MLENKTVLIVDDFATMRKIIKNVIKQLGCKNIVEAENGEEGLQKLKNNSIDVILSDWNMPVMTGLDFLKAVRANPETAEIPFFMITAEAQKEQVVAAIQAKVTNYITKPFTPATIQEKIGKFISE